MVGEFPELQGVMGGYYARAEGLPDAVADAIRDHYKPVGQGDDVPTAPLTVAVSLADKIDTLVSFFAAEMLPTGSKDPFALRRAMLAAQALTETSGLRFAFKSVALKALDLLCPVKDGERWIWGRKAFTEDEKQKFGEGLDWSPQTRVDEPKAISALLDFFADRLKVQQKEAGVRHDLIDAVFALGGEDDLVRLLARVKALQSFIVTEDGTNLLAGYKRAANILKKEGVETAEKVELTYTPEPTEADLITALDAAEPRATAAVQAEDFEGAMAALATLRAPIDAFFDRVTVNDADPAKRAARLALLARVREAVHAVADFSKITA
jgi:glycyl-tRNA synthetase beta chain